MDRGFLSKHGSWTGTTGRLAVLAGCLLVWSCGGGGDSPTGGTPPPSRTRTVIGNFNWELVGIPEAQDAGFAFDFVGFDLSISPIGDVDAIVNWTFATSTVHLYLTSNTCTEQQFAVVQCQLLRSTEGLTSKPRTLNAPGLNGNFRLWVVNLGNTAESGTLQIGVTR